MNVMLEGCEGLCVRTVDYLIFSLLGTVSEIAWLIPLAAELRGLGHLRLGVAHKCPGNCQGMRLLGPPNN